jgi:hypothetical protein
MMVYGDGEQIVRETFDDVRIEREDGWTVVFEARKRSFGSAMTTCNPSNASER